MATWIVQFVEDDLDGSEAAETVKFALDGKHYEIDLSANNAGKFRSVFQPYAAAARKLRGSSGAPANRPPFTGVDNRAVRAWAESNGVEVSHRGRISAEVIEQYRKAGH